MAIIGALEGAIEYAKAVELRRKARQQLCGLFTI